MVLPKVKRRYRKVARKADAEQKDDHAQLASHPGDQGADDEDQHRVEDARFSASRNHRIAPDRHSGT